MFHSNLSFSCLKSFYLVFADIRFSLAYSILDYLVLLDLYFPIIFLSLSALLEACQQFGNAVILCWILSICHCFTICIGKHMWLMVLIMICRIFSWKFELYRL